MKPSIGRIVRYTLSAQDAIEINRRRTNPPSIAERIQNDTWPRGAQAHIGSLIAPGQVFPAIIVVKHSDVCCNLQVFLDGNDTFWGLSRNIATEPYVPADQRTEHGALGHWHWPPREEG